MQQENQDSQVFTSYQQFVIFILAVTQFTVVLDFTVMSPLGDLMMKTLSITTSQFGMAVSAYAFSAGISGFLTAGFADRYDRKKLLLFFYIGFIIGTFFCAIAPNYHLLVAARIFTGIFGGVISSGQSDGFCSNGFWTESNHWYSFWPVRGESLGMADTILLDRYHGRIHCYCIIPQTKTYCRTLEDSKSKFSFSTFIEYLSSK